MGVMSDEASMKGVRHSWRRHELKLRDDDMG
jgi:hypothetical protein